MKVAVAAYPLDAHSTWAAYKTKLTDWVAEAAGQGAKLLVFPEYGLMELAAISGQAADLEASLWAVASLWDDTAALHCDLATRYDVAILSASGPAVGSAGRPVNRAMFCAPGAAPVSQEKQIMTRFEREIWDVVPGAPLQVVDYGPFRIGTLICYDAEFPLLGRHLVEAGVNMILVPSCTDCLAGYWRVRIGAMARALEGQCVVLHAPTVGDAAWSPAVDENVGAAAIYGPPDLGFPETGIIAECALNKPGWTYADIDAATVESVRNNGQVLNMRHWVEQSPRIKG